MKHYEVEGLVYKLTDKQDKEFEKLFPYDDRSIDDEINSYAKSWIMSHGKFMFNIYFV